VTARDLAATKAVACSFCGAPKGTPCPSRNGRRRLAGLAAHPHIARRFAYRVYLASRRRREAEQDYQQWLAQFRPEVESAAMTEIPSKMPLRKAGQPRAAVTGGIPQAIPGGVPVKAKCGPGSGRYLDAVQARRRA